MQIERDTDRRPVERVWALITEAEHLGRWFGDAGRGDRPRPGGRFGDAGAAIDLRTGGRSR